MTTQQAFDQALRHHQAGRLAAAQALYRQVLGAQPAHADALHLLGLTFYQGGNPAQAAELIRRAIAINPRAAGYHTNLGAVVASQGNLDEAAAAFRAALALDPRSPETHNNLGNVLKAQGRIDEAVASYRQALALRPDYPDAYYNLGVALQEAGQIDGAIDAYQRALSLRPAYPQALNNLGNALRDRGRFQDAVDAYRRALALDPKSADAWNNLGNTLKDLDRPDDATEALKKALSLRPDSADVHNNLGNLYRQRDQLDPAIAHLRRALELRPDYPEALSTLGGIYKDGGRIAEAVECLRKSLALRPTPQAADNLLFTLLHDAGRTPRELFEAHAQWNRDFARPLAPARVEFPNDRDPDRRLRIGYVSPDLGDHPVGRFLVPLLEHHDRARFEVYAYTDTPRADAVTERLRAAADGWRTTLGRSDEEVAATIRDDRIDILIDLAMHTRHNRLLAFARRPAPVQVTYLAYSGTTGLQTMDYRLTDPYMDPPGSDESLFSEKTVRLPHTFWCYQSPPHAPPVVLPPCHAAGHVTFGSLNQFAKVTEPALAAWREILARVPQSHLILYAAEGAHRKHATDRFAAAGIDPMRVRFMGRVPTAQYFAQYNQIDVALDTFPYPGGTTTCDALWMGVPVVSLPGETPLSRGGLSVLSNVALPELATSSIDQYIDLAVSLAQSPQRLANLRATMRDRMQRSPLMDAPRFARDVEEAYRMMWRSWCEA